MYPDAETWAGTGRAVEVTDDFGAFKDAYKVQFLGVEANAEFACRGECLFLVFLVLSARSLTISFPESFDFRFCVSWEETTVRVK